MFLFGAQAPDFVLVEILPSDHYAAAGWEI
jgi:hypothetical protein